VKHPYGTLTPDLVRSTYFAVPSSFVPVALGAEGAKEFQEHRDRIQLAGGDLQLIGWPDGTTIAYEQLVRGLPLDKAFLESLYMANALIRRAEAA
jgi:hypothetical protein